MNILKLLLVSVLLGLALTKLSLSSIRFNDDSMMRSHHAHDLPQNISLTKEPINVHLIPHTHDDVGWLKTVDDYYYGNNNSIQNAQVQYVLDTVIDELDKDPEKTFIYVEMAFFTRWWNEQDEKTKETVHRLVKNGQLEFINGGWCMNDEAAPYFEDIIDQMTLGHQFIKQTFNFTTKIGWHIDPFGHSAAHASLFSQMGFEAFFFARIDYQDKEKRMNESSLEMIWRPYQASGEDNSIFTHVNYYHYEAPPGFCFDQNCNDDPIMDDPRLENYNIEKKALDFVNYFKSMSLHYRHNELMHTMGSDFQYSNAHKYFKNMDKLVHYIKQHPELGVNVFYSTPQRYIEKINALKVDYPVKTDDFFPYADCDNGYWTGYFTSRVALKGFVKETGRFFQSIKTLFALVQIKNEADYVRKLKQEMINSVASLQEAMGILQHHDAVSGTSKQQVADDYAFLLDRAATEAKNTLFKYLQLKNNEILNENLKNFMCNWNETFFDCPNIGEVLAENFKSFLLTVYNPGFTRKRVIRVKIPRKAYSVVNAENRSIPSDIFCDNDRNSNDCNLYFVANLPSNGFEYFKITEETEDEISKPITEEHPIDGTTIDFTYSDEISFPIGTKKITINSDLHHLIYSVNNEKHSFDLSYKHYRSYQGPGQKSGAYIFRPDEYTYKNSWPYSSPYYAKIYKGHNLIQISIYGDRVDSHIRLYAEKEIYNQAIEIESFVKPIPIDDEIGKEVTFNIQSTIHNNGFFETDSNGLEMQKRILNYRPTWTLNVTEPVSGNYYPINSMISIKNAEHKLTVLNDRTQGGSSYKNGLIEIMIHRRTVDDDARGVGENLNERDANGVGLTARMRHYVVFARNEEMIERNIQYQLDFAPVVVMAGSQLKKFLRNPTSHEKNMNSVFPKQDNLRIYLQDLGKAFLLRLMNNDETQTKTFNLQHDYIETSLTMLEKIEDLKKNKLKWSQEDESSSTEKINEANISFRPLENKEHLSIKPLEIRTFVVEA